jgi:aryl sulfotransferase
VGSLGQFGLDSRWLSNDETDRLRASLICATQPEDGGTQPRLRKTHEMWRPGDAGAEPFPAAATRAAILVVRDPRDVACSFAPFFGVDLDAAIDAMAGSGGSAVSHPVHGHTAQPWGSWTNHSRSWLAADVPFPVHVVRYEDLRRDAVTTLTPVFDAIGLTSTHEQLVAAVDQAGFERLRQSEMSGGFREVSPNTQTFFRQGRAGGWRSELSDRQVAAIEADHGDVMVELGYELVTADRPRRALAQSRASQRRRRETSWMTPPPHLGLEVRVGDIPDELPGAARPRSGLQTTPRATRVQFPDGNALLVEDGRVVTVQWNLDAEEGDADLSWLIQGWSVTLASLQRGNLSLHASTIQLGDEVVALAGHQGAGKSTTAMGLRGRGHHLLVDDTTVIGFRDGGAWTTPFARNVHLLRDAADALGVDADALPVLGGRIGKYAFRAEEPPEVPHRIDRIVVLTKPKDSTEVELEVIRGAERVRLLRQHVSRRGLAEDILGQATFFGQLARLADAAIVQVLRRPREGWSLDAVLDAIESGSS